MQYSKPIYWCPIDLNPTKRVHPGPKLCNTDGVAHEKAFQGCFQRGKLSFSSGNVIRVPVNAIMDDDSASAPIKQRREA